MIRTQASSQGVADATVSWAMRFFIAPRRFLTAQVDAGGAAAADDATAVVAAGGAADEAAGGAADEAATAEDAEGGAEDAAGGAAALDPPLTFARPGSWVMSLSCWPSGMGPVGFAGHEPAGERGVVWPKGMVPAAPTATPPTKVVAFAPWNWHWNRPLSSAFFGACWQYCTDSLVGYVSRKIVKGGGQREQMYGIPCCAAAGQRSGRT